MPAAKYIVELTADERVHLRQLIRRGHLSARKIARARILLKADQGRRDEQIAQAVEVGLSTVGRVRQRFVEEGFESALTERSRPGQRPKLNGKQQAHLIAVACSSAPEGRARWTLSLLADKVVELGFVDSICRETVRQVLKKTTSSPGSASNGVCRK